MIAGFKKNNRSVVVLWIYKMTSHLLFTCRFFAYFITTYNILIILVLSTRQPDRTAKVVRNIKLPKLQFLSPTSWSRFCLRSNLSVCLCAHGGRITQRLAKRFRL